MSSLSRYIQGFRYAMLFLGVVTLSCGPKGVEQRRSGIGFVLNEGHAVEIPYEEHDGEALVGGDMLIPMDKIHSNEDNDFFP